VAAGHKYLYPKQRIPLTCSACSDWTAGKEEAPLPLSESGGVSRLMQHPKERRSGEVVLSPAAAPSQPFLSHPPGAAARRSHSSSSCAGVWVRCGWLSRAYTLSDFRCHRLMETTASLCDWGNSYTRTRVQNPVSCPMFPLLSFHLYITDASVGQIIFPSQAHIFTIQTTTTK
jgi:hypothetical protein